MFHGCYDLGVPGPLPVPAQRVSGLDAYFDGGGLGGAHRLPHRLHQVLRVTHQQLRRLLVLLRTLTKQKRQPFKNSHQSKLEKVSLGAHILFNG